MYSLSSIIKITYIKTIVTYERSIQDLNLYLCECKKFSENQRTLIYVPNTGNIVPRLNPKCYVTDVGTWQIFILALALTSSSISSSLYIFLKHRKGYLWNKSKSTNLFINKKTHFFCKFTEINTICKNVSNIKFRFMVLYELLIIPLYKTI